jgi:hypothetical protein
VPPSLVAEVQQVVHRYGWGVDDRLPEVLESIFTPDAVWEGNVMNETRVGPFTGREAVMDWLMRFWPVQKDQRRHVFSNLVVETADDEHIVAYVILQMFGSTRAASAYETSAYCRIVLRPDQDGWAIQLFSVGFDSPFWAPHKVEDMEPRLVQLFGIDARDVPRKDDSAPSA